MGVKINFGKEPQTPEQKFLSDLQKWTLEEQAKVDAALADHKYNKEYGISGPDAWKKLSHHGPYATMSGCRAFMRFTDKLGSLSTLHKPEFD